MSPLTSRFPRIASSRCPGKALISQRTPVSYPLPLQRVSCTLSIWVALPEIRMGLTEVVPAAVATTSVVLQSRECFYYLKPRFAKPVTSGQASSKQLSVSHLLSTSNWYYLSSVQIKALYMYLYISSYIQNLGFWKIVRHPNIFLSGIRRIFLFGWSSICDSHWEDNLAYGSFRHFGKSYYVPVRTLGCLNFLEKLSPWSLYFQSCGLWSLVATPALETSCCACRAPCQLLLVFSLGAGLSICILQPLYINLTSKV